MDAQSPMRGGCNGDDGNCPPPTGWCCLKRTSATQSPPVESTKTIAS